MLDIDAHVARYTVAFVDQDAGNLLGSGTLVKYRDVIGVLTCGHVFEKGIRHRKTVGLCTFKIPATAIQKYIVELPPPDAVLVWYSDIREEHPNGWQGRDIAFLPLPPDFMQTVAAAVSVLDLARHMDISEAPAPDGSTLVEVVSGAVAQFSKAPVVRDSVKVAGINGVMNVAKTMQSTSIGEIDYVHLESTPEHGFALPKSFKGTSGGGYWHLYTTMKGTECTIVQSRLQGVAFWECEQPGKIVAHGPRTLFKQFLPTLR